MRLGKIQNLNGLLGKVTKNSGEVSSQFLRTASNISGACKTLPPAQAISESATYDHQLIRPQFFLWSYSLQPLTTNTQRQLLYTTSQYVATPKLKYFSFLSLFWGVSGQT